MRFDQIQVPDLGIAMCKACETSNVLREQGNSLLDQAGLLGPVRHVLQMDESIARAHKTLRSEERATALNLPYARGARLDPMILTQQSIRHAMSCRREFRTALAGDPWKPILEGFDSTRDDFAAGLAELRSQFISALDAADVAVVLTGELADTFDEIERISREQGIGGLVTFLDESFSVTSDVLTADRNWGRESRSPLEWWQWLIIVGILVIAVAALIVCLWWFGCSWISAIWAAFCWGTVAAGGFWAGICIGFTF